MQKSRAKIGARGENIAVDYLKKSGYEIIERNFRAERGELDIIARDGEELVFVEVKTDRSGKFGPPESWVTLRKQKQIAKTAELFLQQLDSSVTPFCRFDVIAITLSRGAEKINHLKNAF